MPWNIQMDLEIYIFVSGFLCPSALKNYAISCDCRTITNSLLNLCV